ncbi:hypothetical protein ACFQ3L_07545 [Lacticaseibacillus jixianensis]|uniref:Uncharacterized protein n=1 Tax=Lacticaseibacillus jixianensis TaxID=2486012 RepID=A0ABW4B954_9LACO|nr:hypothetical protein [Lacticaseibacillus jixianensis]
MALWHLMFNRPAFTKGQAKHIVYTLQDRGEFGGFPVVHVGIVRDTEELLYIDLQFKLTLGLTQDTFENMLKYLLVLSGRLDTAPLSVYFAVMQKNLDELQITYQRYEDHSLDVFFWQGPPIVAPAEDKEQLRFRQDEQSGQ